MSQTLTVELPDEIYQAVKKAAEAAGKTPAEWLVKDLRQRLPVPDGSTEPSEQMPSQEIHPEIHAILQEVAPKLGKLPDELITEWKAKHGAKPRPQLTEKELQTARERFRQHMGAVNSGDPHFADNERIDADLAREYGGMEEKS